MGFLSRFFGSGGTKNVAKERLQLVLIHDRTDISPALMEDLRRDLIAVISNYLEIDEMHIDIDLEREDRSVALVANIPVRTVKRVYARSGRGGETLSGK
ncbi:cell division topological specificity factor MinE [Aminiphilus circumscriptus]|uniref:cell division topological specificity factor MinE n=1 Tax=Aminiphilus circumscriptus TaxID=290732 RepID=UPI0004928946|nr:cell division topological specificity factor MinE [Aminiphilus circumscriptus]